VKRGKSKHAVVAENSCLLLVGFLCYSRPAMLTRQPRITASPARVPHAALATIQIADAERAPV